jgi:hypothetical protein
MRLFRILTLYVLGHCQCVFAQPIVKIGGTENPMPSERQVRWYLDQLNIKENIHLTVIYTTIIPEGFDGLTICRNVLEKDGYQIIMVRINQDLKERQKQTVLAHEMIHVKQYAKGELKLLEPNTVVWLGKKRQLSNKYHSGPWEKEAYREDKILAVQFQQKPEITLAKLKVRTDSLLTYMRKKLP